MYGHLLDEASSRPRTDTVDPQRDLDRVEAVLAERGWTCVLVVDTHLHNDYVSGALELARRTGGLVLPTPGMFGVPEFAAVLEQVVARYGIEVHKHSELIEVDPHSRRAVVADNAAGTKDEIIYDLMHVVPPQSAPDWTKRSPLADPANPAGYVEIDKHTMQHTRWPNVFALGDAGSSPNSKTGAAIRKHAPVVVKNLTSVMAGGAPTAQYDGYASCPLTTARGKMLLAEFDYTMKPHPSFPPRLINAQKERKDMWSLKRYGLPFMYWNLMLKGRA